MAQAGPSAGRPAGDVRSKKKLSTSAITLGTMGVLSTLFVGFCAAQDAYAPRVAADCVDLDSRQPDGSYLGVNDRYCDDDGGSSGSSGYRGSHGAYGWYYGGVWQAGRIRGGTTIRPSNAHISTRSGSVIQRGGFGGRGVGGS
ncbi:hypothetical protein DQ384_31815 [Sphaerisporangium album]|uniref:Uncharacterized protein n=1 Tax=Sphaerisporangium album TaxID=509200 RepID=A0A367F4Z4_9ACTN|nr:hypothetical protein [Sphaerisporangium album]RCG25448.1 hypothetical protein DQ384_31815 [Sphaerisporangium album]